MRIIGPELQRARDCEAVLRTLPKWFGIEHALLMYVEDTTKLPTFALDDGSRLVGFLTLRQHFPEAWEIHCLAIAADSRNRGLGSMLLAHCESWMRERGAHWLQVKTVAETNPSAEYWETRKFYEARGFAPLEIFPELWDPWNPALQYVKSLCATGPER